jgi:hypothetical protein
MLGVLIMLKSNVAVKAITMEEAQEMKAAPLSWGKEAIDPASFGDIKWVMERGWTGAYTYIAERNPTVAFNTTTRFDAFQKSTFLACAADTPEGFAAVCEAMDHFESTDFFKSEEVQALAVDMVESRRIFDQEQSVRQRKFKALAEKLAAN